MDVLKKFQNILPSAGSAPAPERINFAMSKNKTFFKIQTLESPTQGWFCTYS
jgi:hypothetical protein